MYVTHQKNPRWLPIFKMADLAILLIALFDIELQPAHFHELFLHQYQCIIVLHYGWWVYNFKMATNFQNGSC